MTEVKEEHVSIDFVEICGKGQYVNRGDMWRSKLSLCNSIAYNEKKINDNGIIGSIKEIWSNGNSISNGLITEKTKIVWRSRSARYFILIQMSEEMFSFAAEDGDIYFEKAVNFLSTLFEKWKTEGYAHILSVIFFSRTRFKNQPEEMKGVMQDDLGFYCDFFREVIHEETRVKDWTDILISIKKTFQNYGELIGWDKYKEDECYNTNSKEGNFLESINLALNSFDTVNCFFFQLTNLRFLAISKTLIQI